MECIILDYVGNNYGNDLFSLLRDNVIHMTTQEGYKSIRKDGYIYANTKGKYPAASGHPECYGNCHGLVCLFDLRGKTYEEIDDPTRSFLMFPHNTFRISSNQKRMVYLVLSPIYYGSLIPSDTIKILDDVSNRGYHIPKIECWFPEKIPFNCIETALCVRVTIPPPQNPCLRAVYEADSA